MKIFSTPNYLKSKVGSGGLPEHILDKAEELIKKGDVGFEKYASDYLAGMDKVRTTLNEVPLNDELRLNLVVPIMSLKAHGKMFGYELISEVSAILYDFAENFHEYNDDARQIFDVYSQSLTAVLDSQLRGDCGAAGLELLHELYSACQRFYQKYQGEMDLGAESSAG